MRDGPFGHGRLLGVQVTFRVGWDRLFSTGVTHPAASMFQPQVGPPQVISFAGEVVFGHPNLL